MHSSALRRLLIPIALAALAALFLVLPNSDNSSEASHTPGSPSFNFTGDWQFCNNLISTFGGPAPLPGPTVTGCTAPDRIAAFGSSPNQTSNTLLTEGNLNYAQDTLVSFSPPSWTIANGTAVIPLGTVIGGVSSGTSLGLLTGSCATPVTPEFIMYNASVDNSAGNILVVDPEGTDARFDTMVGANGDDDGFAGKADSDALLIGDYPDMSNRMFDPDGSGTAAGGFSPVQPWARYASMSQVPAGGDYQVLQIFVFQAGALKTAFSANDANDTHPFSRLDASYGWTSIVVLNDPTATVTSPNPISDFCTVLDVDIMLLGDPAGAGTRLTLPADATDSIDGKGTFLLPIWVASTRDTDGDGLENAIDTCPTVANVEDPYIDSGNGSPDADGDALDSACDPTPADATSWDATNNETTGDVGVANCGNGIDDGDPDSLIDIADPECHDDTGSQDIDGDGFLNSQDLCPLVADGGANQKDSENATDYDVAAPDGGPLGDGIGDLCETDDTVSNGLFFWGMVTDALCVGSEADGGDAGSEPDLDNDSDGWCHDGAGGADPNDANGTITAAATQDTDGDGYPNDAEIFMNTDPIIKCTQDPVAAPYSHDSWPADIVISRTINISDVFALLPPAFGSAAPGPPYTKRADMVPSGTINITDLFTILPPTFGTSCAGPVDPPF